MKTTPFIYAIGRGKVGEPLKCGCACGCSGSKGAGAGEGAMV